MAFHRLTWRVGLPFVLLVLFTAVALPMFVLRRTELEDRQRFERLAQSIGAVVGQLGIPKEGRLAGYLGTISNHVVYFRDRGGVFGAPGATALPVPLSTQPADSRAVRHGDHELVAVSLGVGADLLMVREVRPALDPRLLAMLAAFVVCAMLTAWLVVRGLVRPLQNLARQLPDIERAGALELPEAARNDEIGDLARAFLRTRAALHDERQARERAEKLAVLGRMTAALAHEVQNPVAAIRMHAQLWRAATEDGTAATIEHEASRIESMLNQWMFLTRPEPPATAELEVGALLARVVAMHEAQARHAAVTIQLDAPPGLVVAADARRLEQVFRNLLGNALQAMPGGGTLAIRAARAGDVLEVTFADTGAGFSPAALQRFAEFFFSEREGGMGIGLSVASEICRAHGGRLRVANRATGGAVVTVELPVAARPVVAAP
jgi:signal transduction histidine kinase